MKKIILRIKFFFKHKKNEQLKELFREVTASKEAVTLENIEKGL